VSFNGHIHNEGVLYSNVRVCWFYDEIRLYARTACVDIFRHIDWIMTACVCQKYCIARIIVATMLFCLLIVMFGHLVFSKTSVFLYDLEKLGWSMRFSISITTFWERGTEGGINSHPKWLSILEIRECELIFLHKT